MPGTDLLDERLAVSSLDRVPDPAGTFRALYGREPYAFWMDRESGAHGPPGRSIMGAGSGPGSEVLLHDVARGATEVHVEGRVAATLEGPIIENLRRRRTGRGRPADAGDLGFGGGHVGYLGYEVRAELGSPVAHRSELPDACLISPRSFVVLDHGRGVSHAVCVIAPGEDPSAAVAEARALRGRLEELTGDEPAAAAPIPAATRSGVALDRAAYLAAVDEIRGRLYRGEAYEACLTDRLEVEFEEAPDPLGLYLRLRERSAAPAAGYMRVGDAALLCASPEHFLRIDPEGRVRTDPIKGTRRRDDHPGIDRALREELLASPKERAENVMIVDVLRNDLGRVCAYGTVEVGRLAEVESFTHVHQLVSTVTGRLAPGRDALDCLAACFPGGSMTGAPKLRAMEILGGLEPVARGPYSGAFGWFGTDGALDLSIVIRSIVLAGRVASVGAGGAVTVLSDPRAEYEEMILKARPLLELLGSPPGAI
jgi:para-aminobenzoate synthetase